MRECVGLLASNPANPKILKILILTRVDARMLRTPGPPILQIQNPENPDPDKVTIKSPPLAKTYFSLGTKSSDTEFRQ